MRKRILVAPLDWGLGHATRCIPIIREIISLGHEVVLATDGRAYNLLKEEFPETTLIRLTGYHPVYPGRGNMVFAMVRQVPKFLFAIAREHFQLKKIIRDYLIDVVISDNRYGLCSKKTTCVFITHQIFIKMPVRMKWMEPAVNGLNHFFISRFNRCWVPDAEGDENLGGELSHGEKIPLNVEYIGITERLARTASPPPPLLWRGESKLYRSGNTQESNLAINQFDLLALLSGPEPQRTILEDEIKKQLALLQLRALIVRGVTEETKRVKLSDWVESVSYLTSKEIVRAMEESKVVVCRAGYSSLMELISLGKKAIIIPTPGQTEQEYLADRCRKLNYFSMQSQPGFDLKKALLDVEKTSPPVIPSNSSLKPALNGLLAEI